MLLIDDFPIVLIIKGLFAELSAYLFPDLSDQPVPDGAVAVDIVRRHAGLSAVQIFPEYDPPRRQSDVRGLIDDAGAFSAQFKGHRRQMICSASHNFLPHRLTACKENIIKMLVQKTGVFRPSTGHDRHILRLKTFREDLPDHLACVWRIGARFDYCRIPGRQRIHERGEGEHEGVIPRAHDQRHTVRRRLLITS